MAAAAPGRAQGGLYPRYWSEQANGLQWWDSEPPAVWQEDGHMVARVRPSQALSDLLVEALKKDGD